VFCKEWKFESSPGHHFSPEKAESPRVSGVTASFRYTGGPQMGLVLKYVQTTKAGTLHYRRKVPKTLKSAFGATEFKRKLGDNPRQALLAYPLRFFYSFLGH
jgi:hypothetical protein